MTLDKAQSILSLQPFSVLMGATVTLAEGGEVVIELPLRTELKQQLGFAHGGVVSYLADNTLTYAGASALGEDVITVEMKINYLRPASGDRLVAKAIVISASKRLAVCRCDVFIRRGDGDVLCAAAQGTIARLLDVASAEVAPNPGDARV